MIPKLKQSEFRTFSRAMARDLQAAFALMSDDVQQIIAKAARDGWTIEKTQDEILKLLS